jgi:hypothetical protein
MEEEKNINEAEQTVTFKASELMYYGVLDYDGNELMAAITGYDLNVSFNMRLINSLADAESCANALADVFYQALMEKLIERKGDSIKPNATD